MIYDDTIRLLDKKSCLESNWIFFFRKIFLLFTLQFIMMNIVVFCLLKIEQKTRIYPNCEAFIKALFLDYSLTHQ
jgi:hypothetical protein